MKIIPIKQEKQSNGLWSTPHKCVKIKGMPLFNDHLLLLWSAITCAINEKYNRNFEVSDFANKGIYIYIWENHHEDSRSFLIDYDKYDIINNTLYEFDNKQEKINFLRKHKLLKLNETS